MEFSKMCRLCVKEKFDLVSLFENNGDKYLKSLTLIEVNEFDLLPTKTCRDCWDNLQKAYTIQQKFIQADQEIRDNFTNEQKLNGSKTSTIFSTESNVEISPCLDLCSEHTTIKTDDVCSQTIQCNSKILKHKNICTECGRSYKYEKAFKKHFTLVHQRNMNKETSKLLENIQANHLEYKKEIDKSDEEKQVIKNFFEHDVRINEEIRDIENIPSPDSFDDQSVPEKLRSKDETASSKFKCSECNKSFKSQKLCLAHARNHMKKKCTICGVKIGKYNLKSHIKIHTDGPQECSICKQMLKNKRTLQCHIETVHNTNTNSTNIKQICYICGKNLKCDRILKKHLRNIHQIFDGEPQKHATEIEYVCSECNKKFSERQKYLAHINNHRKKDCPICKQSISRFNFTKHVRLHSEGPKGCHLCGVTCKNSESLRGHLYYTHSTKEFKCDICDRSFKKSYDRIVHIKKMHTGERNHVCDHCGNAFITLFQLKNHIKIHHSNLKPYTCNTCGKGFSNMKALLQHERHHISINSYTCDICLATFSKKILLRNHKSTQHNTVELKRCECSLCGKIYSSEFALKNHFDKSHKDIDGKNEQQNNSKL